MADSDQPLESKFGKSLLNRRTENAGLAVLLRDGRFQVLPASLKREVARLLGVPLEFGTKAFDAVMTDTPAPALTADNLPDWVTRLHLVEMKTTRKAVDERLGGFFFGVTGVSSSWLVDLATATCSPSSCSIGRTSLAASSSFS